MTGLIIQQSSLAAQPTAAFHRESCRKEGEDRCLINRSTSCLENGGRASREGEVGVDQQGFQQGLPGGPGVWWEKEDKAS